MALIPFGRKGRNVPSNFFEDFHNLVDNFFEDHWIDSPGFGRENFKVNIQEKEDEYVVSAELPDVKKDQIHLDLRDGRLTIQVKREDIISEEKENYIHRESYYNSMSRSVYLPDTKEEGIKAKLENGMLNITLPREQNSNRRKIDIE